jgi:hypothetical protein
MAGIFLAVGAFVVAQKAMLAALAAYLLAVTLLGFWVRSMLRRLDAIEQSVLALTARVDAVQGSASGWGGTLDLTRWDWRRPR